MKAAETGAVRRRYGTGWLASLAVYRQPRLIAILLMGFSSGLPLALTASTLSFWLAEIGVSLTTIRFFSLVGISYNLKFLWSPLIDRLPIPFLTARLGRRRSWALAIQVPLGLAILAMGLTDPRSDPAATAIAAVVVAFLSASQDIVIDAYRIELLLPEEQGASAVARLRAWLGRAVVAPFVDLFRRTGGLGFIVIVLFIVLYKFGEALAGTMSNPLYVSLGFTKPEVANIGKIYGFAATLAGLALGGVVVYRIGVFRALLICGILQASSNLMYAVQVCAGHDVAFLAVTIGYENLTNGMGSAAFVSYLSGLCNVAFTATQYALLSSLAGVGRTILSAWGGKMAFLLGWTPFFLVSTVLCIPGLLLLLWVMRAAPATAARTQP